MSHRHFATNYKDDNLFFFLFLTNFYFWSWKTITFVMVTVSSVLLLLFFRPSETTCLGVLLFINAVKSIITLEIQLSHFCRQTCYLPKPFSDTQKSDYPERGLLLESKVSKYLLSLFKRISCLFILFIPIIYSL